MLSSVLNRNYINLFKYPFILFAYKFYSISYSLVCKPCRFMQVRVVGDRCTESCLFTFKTLAFTYLPGRMFNYVFQQVVFIDEAEPAGLEFQLINHCIKSGRSSVNHCRLHSYIILTEHFYNRIRGNKRKC